MTAVKINHLAGKQNEIDLPFDVRKLVIVRI